MPMQETSVTAIQAIQAILAPALGISAVGLLLLGISNRYSAMVSRIRLLNDEKRRFSQKIVDLGNLSYTENARFMSIAKQTEELLLRSRYARNAILAMQAAIGLFVMTSASIALNLVSNAEFFKIMPLMIFIVGMLAVFVGMIYAAAEVYRSYKIVLIEGKGEE
jgi:hypothetical protein